MCHGYRSFFVTTKLTRDSSVSVVTRLRGVQLEVYVQEICFRQCVQTSPQIQIAPYLVDTRECLEDGKVTGACR